MSSTLSRNPLSGIFEVVKRRTSYQRKLQDPRWQRKRASILDRADYQCEWCGNDKETLHVHHGFYGKNAEPWEYENDTLYCLCDTCHEQAEIHRRTVYCQLGRVHPRHHASIAVLLEQVQRLVCQDVNALEGRWVEWGSPDDGT